MVYPYMLEFDPKQMLPINAVKFDFFFLIPTIGTDPQKILMAGFICFYKYFYVFAGKLIYGNTDFRLR